MRLSPPACHRKSPLLDLRTVQCTFYMYFRFGVITHYLSRSKRQGADLLASSCSTHKSKSAEAISHDSRASAAHIASGTLLMWMMWMAFLVAKMSDCQFILVNVSNQACSFSLATSFAKINLTQLNAVCNAAPSIFHSVR